MFVTNNLYLLICQKNFMILASQTQFLSYSYQKAVLTTFSTSASKSFWQRTMFHFRVPKNKSSCCWEVSLSEHRFVAGLTKFEGIRKEAIKQAVVAIAIIIEQREVSGWIQSWAALWIPEYECSGQGGHLLFLCGVVLPSTSLFGSGLLHCKQKVCMEA